MTTDPTAGEGPTPSGAPEPSAAPTPSEAPPPPRPAGTGFFDSIRRSGLYRADQRWVGGVASGVAARLGWDPLLVRGILVITFFLGGIGLVAYGIAWALLPEQSDGRIHLEQAIRGNFDVALLGAAVLFLFGFAWGGPWDWTYVNGGWIAAVFWLAIIGGIVYLLIQAVRRRPSTEGAPHAQPYPGPAAPVSPAAGGVVGFDEHQAPAAPSGTMPAAPPPPAYSVAPPTPPVPPRPPRRKGGGIGIVFGLMLLTGALLLYDALVLDGVPSYLPINGEVEIWGAWIGISLLIVGIAIVVAGLRGRSSGGLGALAIIGLVLGAPTLVVLQEDLNDRINDGRAIVDEALEFDGRVDGYEPGAPISEGTFSPSRIAEAENGYSVSWGDPTIDLTDLDLSEVDPGDPVEVPIAIGAGGATVIVPEDAAVEVEGLISAGALEWHVDGDERTYSGIEGQRVEITSDEVGDDGPELRVLVEVAAGELIIEEEQ